MTLVLVPIPSESVKGTANLWLPFVQRIAERTRQHVNDLVAQIVANEVQLHLVWDPETQTAHALAGTRIIRRGHDRIGEILWTPGIGCSRWLPLLAGLDTLYRYNVVCDG